MYNFWVQVYIISFISEFIVHTYIFFSQLHLSRGLFEYDFSASFIFVSSSTNTEKLLVDIIFFFVSSIRKKIEGTYSYNRKCAGKAVLVQILPEIQIGFRDVSSDKSAYTCILKTAIRKTTKLLYDSRVIDGKESKWCGIYTLLQYRICPRSNLAVWNIKFFLFFFIYIYEYLSWSTW